MATTDKNTLRSWFLTGLKPLQAQFWAWMDSYWHKDEQIPQSAISNLTSTLNAKAEKSQFDAHKTDLNAHEESFALKLDNGGYNGTAQDLKDDIENISGYVINELTGSVIDLSNRMGNYYNMYEANSSISYSIIDIELGGKAIVLVCASSEPTVTGAFKTIKDTFTPNEKMYLTIWNNGNRVEYFFTTINHETIIDLTALPYGAIINTSTNPATIYLGTPSIIKTASGRFIASNDYFGSGSTTSMSSIFISNDDCLSWIKVQDINSMFWGTLFEYAGNQYILGVSNGTNGNLVISKSTDNGMTWSASVSLITSIDAGFVSSSTSFIIKDGYFAKAFEIAATTGTWAGIHKSVMVFGNLSNLMTPSNWNISNQITYNNTTFPITIGGNGSVAKRPQPNATASKGWMEGNLIEKLGGGIMILLRLEQANNSNYAIYLDVTWNSGAPATSTISSTHNYIQMPGGGCKFKVLFDATSNLYWSITNVNKYKYFDDNRTEAYLISSPDLLTWTVKEKAVGYDFTVNWETEVYQYGAQYSDFTIDGNDMYIVTRVGNALANNYHNANLMTVTKIVNFRTSVAEIVVDGSLIIDSNSTRIEDSNGITIIRDQSKYYNSPFMLAANNSAKPNWISGGIQFDGASYLRVPHNEYLNLDYGLSIFVVIENLQSTTPLRILSKSSGSSNDIGTSDWSFSTDGLTVGACYISSGWGDLTVGQNYILAASYDRATNSFYNFKNGVNRGAPGAISGGTWSTDKILKTDAYTQGNTAELRIGNRTASSALFFTSKIKALHVIPSFKTSSDMTVYMNMLNAIYLIY